MLILLDCRTLSLEGEGSERSHIIFLAITTLARDRGVKWLFVVDQSWREDLFPLPAGSSLLRQRAFPGRMGWRLWYDWLIPRLAKKHKVDWVMLAGGIAAAPTAARQCIWMPEKANPSGMREYPSLYSRRLIDSLHRVSLAFCFSAADKAWLAQQGTATDAEKLALVSAWPSEEIGPLSTIDREAIKHKYAQGKEYFWTNVTMTGEAGIVALLKSFSLFKKRQLSNMQLIFASSRPELEGTLKSRLETYKYRQDIHWYGLVEGGLPLMQAAYALVFPFEKKTLGVPVLNAWKAEVPVIIGRDTGLQELAGDGALVADTVDPASLAGQLMKIYKDEGLRKNLIENGLSRVAAFNLQLTLDEIWKGLNRTTPYSGQTAPQPISG